MNVANYQCEARMSSATATMAEYLCSQQTSGNVAALVFEPGFQILNEIEVGGRLFRLRQPVDVTVSVEDGLWINETKALSIVAVGDTKDEALRSFRDDFSILWDQIASAPDDSLTGDAIGVKRVLSDMVESVVTAG